MRYTVKMTMSDTLQVSETISYISKGLLAPDTALKWSNYLQKEIAGLDAMPAKFALVEEEPWRTKGIHKMTVKNFYCILLD